MNNPVVGKYYMIRAKNGVLGRGDTSIFRLHDIEKWVINYYVPDEPQKSYLFKLIIGNKDKCPWFMSLDNLYHFGDLGHIILIEVDVPNELLHLYED